MDNLTIIQENPAIICGICRKEEGAWNAESVMISINQKTGLCQICYDVYSKRREIIQRTTEQELEEICHKAKIEYQKNIRCQTQESEQKKIASFKRIFIDYFDQEVKRFYHIDQKNIRKLSPEMQKVLLHKLFHRYKKDIRKYNLIVLGGTFISLGGFFWYPNLFIALYLIFLGIQAVFRLINHPYPFIWYQLDFFPIYNVPNRKKLKKYYKLLLKSGLNEEDLFKE